MVTQLITSLLLLSTNVVVGFQIQTKASGCFHHPSAPSSSKVVGRLFARTPVSSAFDIDAIEAFEKELDLKNRGVVLPEITQEDVYEPPPGCESITITIDAKHSGKRIDAAIVALSDGADLSRSLAGTLIADGHVRVVDEEGKLEAVTRKAFKVSEGLVLQIDIPQDDTPTDIQAENLPLSILFEDEHMIVLNKAADMVVHPAAGNWNGTVVNALAYYLANDSPFGTGEFVGSQVLEDAQQDIKVDGTDGETVHFRPGIVHRLDKGTTGVLVVAKTTPALAALSASFKNRKVRKTYLALTVGNPGKQVVIDKPIGRHPVHRQRMRVVPDPHKRNSGGFAPKDRMPMGSSLSQTPSQVGRRALSYVDTIAFDGKLSLVQVRIETGRTHQIRVHLQDRHTPVYGDDVYGLADWNKRLSKVHAISRPLLHAYTLELNHPITGEEMKFRAPLAQDMHIVASAVWPQGKEERSDLFKDS